MHRLTPRRARAAALAASIGLLCLSIACGAFREEELPPEQLANANLLADAGFEGAAPAWVAFPPADAHQVVTDRAHSGESSMALRLGGDIAALSVSQSLNPNAFPEFVSGYYRVDDWPDGEAFLQFVVKVPGGSPEEVREVRFVIAGASVDPEPAPQARYVFLSRDAPSSGAWRYFAYPIRQAFETRVGAVPQAWTSVDISLEARMLAVSPEMADAPEAVVYFDDMYVGLQAENPNRPNQTTK
jgi:hypothetical protein